MRNNNFMCPKIVFKGNSTNLIQKPVGTTSARVKTVLWLESEIPEICKFENEKEKKKTSGKEVPRPS